MAGWDLDRVLIGSVLLFLSALAGGIPPLWLLRRKQSKYMRSAMAFTGGTLFSGALLHVLPDAEAQLRPLSNSLNYPIAFSGAVLGFMLLLLLDTVVNNSLRYHSWKESKSSIDLLHMDSRVVNFGALDRRDGKKQSESSDENHWQLLPSATDVSQASPAIDKPLFSETIDLRYNEPGACCASSHEENVYYNILGKTQSASTQEFYAVSSFASPDKLESRDLSHCCMTHHPYLEGLQADYSICKNDTSQQVSPHASAETLLSTGNRSIKGKWVSFLLLLALSIHSLIEGLVLGSATQAQVLLVAVILHKTIVAFGLGASLLGDGHKLKNYVFILLCFCLISPLGLLLGTSLKLFGANPTVGYLVGLITGIGGGSFLYVSLLEIIGPELSRCRKHDSSSKDAWLLLLASTVGILLMAAAAYGG